MKLHSPERSPLLLLAVAESSSLVIYAMAEEITQEFFILNAPGIEVVFEIETEYFNNVIIIFTHI